jgi:hypothetical protein
MKQRGRKSSAATSVEIRVDGRPDTLELPDNLSADGRRRFFDIVANCDRGHFQQKNRSRIGFTFHAVEFVTTKPNRCQGIGPSATSAAIGV